MSRSAADIQAEITRIQQQMPTLSPAELPAAVARLNTLIDELKTITVAGDLVAGDKVGRDQYKAGGDININPPDPDRTDPQVLGETYLRWVIRQTNRLDLAGIDPKAAGGDEEMKLSGVYTALLTQQEETGVTIPMGVGGKRQKISALEQLNRHRHLVLLGDPGGGKSTFVNFVAGCMAAELLGEDAAGTQLSLDALREPLPLSEDEKRQRRNQDEPDEPEPQPWRHGPLLPVVVTLRRLAADGLPAAHEEAGAGTFWSHVAAELHKAGQGEYAPLLKKVLLEEGGLLLFDGLDEVPTADQHRLHIKQMVTDVAATYPRCRILVTSRTYAYQKQDWRLPNFEAAVLAPFSEGQIERFVDRWYAQVAQERGLDSADAQGRATLLKTAVKRSKRLRDLAQKPLLLTLMASLHAWRGGSLPEKREELYNDAVDLLLDNWEQQRITRDADGEITVIEPSLAQWLEVDQDKVRDLLCRLAFEAHRDQAGTEDTANIEGEKLVLALLRLSPQQTLEKQEQLVAYLSHRAGLLLPRGHGVYTFPHRTFQEYLAAVHLTDDDYPHKVAELARRDPDRWREVALLAGAKAGRGSAFALWGLVDELCPADLHGEDEDAAHWGTLLAGQLVAETADLDGLSTAQQAKADRVRHGLVTVGRTGRLPAVERAAAGRHLAVVGDPEAALMNVDRMAFCYVPAGPFWMGSEDGKDNEKPLHRVDIPYGYWIGRYPVTNAQYAAFVDAGGYKQETYWPEGKAADVWRNGKVVDWSDQPRTRPRDFGEPYNLPNYPLVGITWYEGVAFARWLTERWRAAGRLSEGWSIMLPGEAEWEKAARGGIQLPDEMWLQSIDDIQSWPPEITARRENRLPQRVYPWGDARPVDGNANYEAAQIGSGSRPGLFTAGRSPYGVEELSGNVWEWTRSRYESYPYAADDGRETLARGKDDWTILRGGGYMSKASDIRCSARLGASPPLDVVVCLNFGVRVVVSPFHL